MRFLWGFWRTWNYLFLRRKKSEPVIRISTAVESPSPSVNTHYNVTGEMMIEVRWLNARQNALGGHERYHLRSACLAYLLGSFMRKTLSSVSFPLPRLPRLPAADPGRRQSACWTTTSLLRSSRCWKTRRPQRQSPRSQSGLWHRRGERKVMLGGLGPLRMLSRMSLQRETSLELRASTFQDAMESFYLLTTRDGRERWNLSGNIVVGK